MKKQRVMKAELLKHEEFGHIRVQYVEGEPWFAVKDVCDALELRNPSMVVQSLEENERAKLNLGRASTGSQGKAWHVNESGLYHLIFNSRKPEAMRFRKW